MSVTKPDPLLWATGSNGADSIAVVPSSGRKASGYDGTTFPEFVYENWYKRQVMLWQQWFDQQEQYCTAGVSALLGTSGSFNAVFSSAKTVAFNYIKYASGLVRIWWPDVTGLSTSSSNESDASIPSSILPSSSRVSFLYTGATGSPSIFGSPSVPVGRIVFKQSNSKITFYNVDESFTVVYAGIAEYFI